MKRYLIFAFLVLFGIDSNAGYPPRVRLSFVPPTIINHINVKDNSVVLQISMEHSTSITQYSDKPTKFSRVSSIDLKKLNENKETATANIIFNESGKELSKEFSIIKAESDGTDGYITLSPYYKKWKETDMPVLMQPISIFYTL